MSSATGFTMPSTFETCVKATTRVRGDEGRGGIHVERAVVVRRDVRSTAPVRAASSCHGMRFAWCSIAVVTISSPGRTSPHSRWSTRRG
jgi:hypothetical protein